MASDDIFYVNENDKVDFIRFDKSYSFFDGIVSFLAGLCSTNLLIDSYLTEALPYKEGHYLFFEGRKKVSNKIFYFFPYDIYRYLINNEWPTEIKLHYKHKEFEDQETISDSLDGFAKIFLSLGQATYIQFWESIKSRIGDRFGKDQTTWDSIFQFGWIVRNALAHNFKVAVNNRNIDNVPWKGLTFGFSTNELDISTQMMFLELILLMKDIEDKLNENVL